MRAMNPDQPSGLPNRRAATVLESVEEIRARARIPRPATMKEAVQLPAAMPAGETLSVCPAFATAGVEAQPFRPVRRPPMALLLVLDDGDDEGEAIRIRTDAFTIGRVQGDLVIPHDGGISGRHAEISRRPEGGEYRWYLRDLQSTNGTFVRASNVVLRDGQELLLGSLHFRFEGPAPVSGPPPTAAMVAATQKWQALSSSGLAAAAAAHPALVEQTADGAGRRFPLTAPEIAVGRDPRQSQIVLDDLMVSPLHARIVRDPKGRWAIYNASSLNGLWARVEEVPLNRGGQFQCGEQRFQIRIL
jgi:pSer/pThr/pTyr-binding forkhead associated (FHA) protein